MKHGVPSLKPIHSPPLTHCPHLSSFLLFSLLLRYSVTRSTSMEHIYVLFEMIKLLHIYVLEDGVLSGVISRSKLLTRLKALERRH
jgi:hypothetical protein